ncbi:SpaA isopeptide-forming pilin-related protein [Clostridium sp. LIBA-8841]|uniref:SpaA isopeptide-forming pilin-related protein n=1 Tax=Clostridium sp. LIBA-8841 TaxID=2987530 RepID=UPI002AC6C7A8|nr:SpaA isopeptide-forming pilin-related protein [Clostridium sp. LIBA-8841]MDZ5255182.1 SpaA isopeptide-forming pilin-related protein [Clostridium sp. LIBA-8841]
MKRKKKYFITALATFISMLLSIISPGVLVFGENSKLLQGDGGVEITSATFQSNTVSKDIINTLQIDYKILDKSKLKPGDKIVIEFPDIFKDITPVYSDAHFTSCTNKNGVVTLIFNENVEKAVTGYLSIRVTGNSNIRQGVKYPVNIDLNGQTKTIDVTGNESQGGGSGKYPLMYKTANLPNAAIDKDGVKQYYGEITDRNKPITYYIEINLGDGINPHTRQYLNNAKFVDNIPKGMALDTASIHIRRDSFSGKSTDATQEFWDNNKLKADTKSLEVDFGDIPYDHYFISYNTLVTSTEDGYLNNANLYYDSESKDVPSSHYSRLSKDAGALNVYKHVDKTNVTNDPNDQKIKYQIKFDSYGHFLKDTLNIVDTLDSRLSDIKITSTDQFTTNFDETTKKLTIKNDKAAIDPNDDAYITIEASMKNVKPGDEVKNIAYVNGNPTNEVSTKKNPLVEIIKISKNDAEATLLDGAIFKLTTKDGNPVKDVYGKEITNIISSSESPITLELPYGDYKLEETKAPDGYKLGQIPIKFNVNNQSKVVKVVAKDDPLPTTCNLVINKIDEKDDPILGAEFELAKQDDPENALKFSSEQDNYEINENGTINLVPLGNDASFKINNLPYGNYILKEIKSPNGYKLSEDIYITLNSEESFYKIGEQGEKIILNKNSEIDGYSISVKNIPRIILPETGGSGTFKFYLIGITLLAGVLILLVSTKFILKERKN